MEGEEGEDVVGVAGLVGGVGGWELFCCGGEERGGEERRVADGVVFMLIEVLGGALDCFELCG